MGPRRDCPPRTGAPMLHFVIRKAAMSQFAGKFAVPAALLVAVLLLTACASTSLVSPTPSSSAPTATPIPSSAEPTATPRPTAYPVATLFTSPLYKYSVTLPAGWLVIPAETAWDGNSAVGHADPIVDQLFAPQVEGRCPTVPLCGPVAWAYAAPTTASLDAYVKEKDAADARDHPCSSAPESADTITIGGEPGVLESRHCPAVGGILVVSAFTIHNGVAYVFYLQDPYGDPAAEPLDQSDFVALIAAIQLP